MKRIAFILGVCILSSCGGKEIQKDTELRFLETNVSVNRKDEIRIPFYASEIDPYDIKLEIDDFIAYGRVSNDVVIVEGTHVGETTAVISYGNIKSECEITVNGLLDSRFLATPLLAFGESVDYLKKNNTTGVLTTGTESAYRYYFTNWAALVPNWGDVRVNEHYTFKNGKLDYVYVTYGGIPNPIKNKSSVKSTFSQVLSERYRLIDIDIWEDKWERPGEYVVRLYIYQFQDDSFSVFLQYAKDFATINDYGNPTN